MTPDLRFPLGPLSQLPAAERVPATLERFVARMEGAVNDWQSLVSGLDAAALARPYREGGRCIGSSTTSPTRICTA